MPKYRKIPVVIEAFQMTRQRRVDNSEWPNWMHKAWNKERETVGSLYPTEEGTGDGTLVIGTLEGKHLVSWNDWIIQGVQGELYSCKPDIFDFTYVEKEDAMTTTPSTTVREYELEKKRLEFIEWQNSEHFSIDDVDYEVVEKFIETCGMTMVPALLLAAAKAAKRTNCFSSSLALIRFVATAIEEEDV